MTPDQQFWLAMVPLVATSIVSIIAAVSAALHGKAAAEASVATSQKLDAVLSASAPGMAKSALP